MSPCKKIDSQDGGKVQEPTNKSGCFTPHANEPLYKPVWTAVNSKQWQEQKIKSGRIHWFAPDCYELDCDVYSDTDAEPQDVAKMPLRLAELFGVSDRTTKTFTKSKNALRGIKRRRELFEHDDLGQGRQKFDTPEQLNKVLRFELSPLQLPKAALESLTDVPKLERQQLERHLHASVDAHRYQCTYDKDSLGDLQQHSPHLCRLVKGTMDGNELPTPPESIINATDPIVRGPHQMPFFHLAPSAETKNGENADEPNNPGNKVVMIESISFNPTIETNSADTDNENKIQHCIQSPPNKQRTSRTPGDLDHADQEASDAITVNVSKSSRRQQAPANAAAGPLSPTKTPSNHPNSTDIPSPLVLQAAQRLLELPKPILDLRFEYVGNGISRAVPR